jgi:hypothetical protein
LICRRQVGFAVAVEIGRYHSDRRGANNKGHLGGEAGSGGAGSGRVAQHRERRAAVVRDDQIGHTVTVNVGRRHCLRKTANGERLLGREGGNGGAGGGGVEQYRNGAGAPVGDDQIRLAIAINVSRCH